MKTAAPLMFAVSLVINQAYAQPVTNSGIQNSGQQLPADGAIYDVLARLEQLQSEVQQLRGMVEEQAQTISDLERKQSNMYSDLDGRVQALAPVSTQQSVAATQTTATTPDATAAQAAATTAVAQPAVTQPPAQAPQTPEVKPVPVATANAVGNEKERYQQAYDTLRNGHNAQAISMFESLLKDNPSGEFADNSQYWLAEAFKINRDYDKAKAAFNKVINQYPNSSKVPDALLKLGYIEFDQQNNAKARDYLTRVTSSFPGSTAAHLAAKKLAQMPQ